MSTDVVRDEQFRVVRHSPDGPLGSPDPVTEAFIEAMALSFLEGRRSKEELQGKVDRFRLDGSLLTMVHDDNQPSIALDAEIPVATFAEFPGKLCVREGVLVDTHMVTEVTVRTSHRRRGLLTKMMHASFDRAKEAGRPLAALTATEGVIYGRFGFGVAAHTGTCRVKVLHGLRLRDSAIKAIEDSGVRVVVPSWDEMPAIHRESSEAFVKRMPGQIAPVSSQIRRAEGMSNYSAEPGENHDLRPLVALGPDGAVRGHAIAEFSGWESNPFTLQVHELMAADPVAELALWQALGATDLVAELSADAVVADHALRVALINGRDVIDGETKDALWLRMLDVPEAMRARGLSSEGSVVLDVTDPLGYAQGTFLIETDENETRVTESPEDGSIGADVPRLSLDAEALAALYLGTCRVADLVASGRAQAKEAGLEALHVLFHSKVPPINTTYF